MLSPLTSKATTLPFGKTRFLALRAPPKSGLFRPPQAAVARKGNPGLLQKSATCVGSFTFDFVRSSAEAGLVGHLERGFGSRPPGEPGSRAGGWRPQCSVALGGCGEQQPGSGPRRPCKAPGGSVDPGSPQGAGASKMRSASPGLLGRPGDLWSPGMRAPPEGRLDRAGTKGSDLAPPSCLPIWLFRFRGNPDRTCGLGGKAGPERTGRPRRVPRAPGPH